MTTLSIAVVGLLALVGLAGIIGLTESGSLRSAWVRIATERRSLAEHARMLDEREEALAEEGRRLYEWEGQLIRTAESGRCPACELRRRHGDRPAG